MVLKLMVSLGCALSLTACHIETYEDEHGEDCDGAAGQSGKLPAAGGSSGTATGGSGGDGSGGSAGSASGGSAGAGSGGSAGSAVGGSAGASAATCADQQTEAACVVFGDCEPIYAGVDCSCGPDCACMGGEPGCVCASFEFFACQSTTQ